MGSDDSARDSARYIGVVRGDRFLHRARERTRARCAHSGVKATRRDWLRGGVKRGGGRPCPPVFMSCSLINRQGRLSPPEQPYKCALSVEISAAYSASCNSFLLAGIISNGAPHAAPPSYFGTRW